MPAAVVLTASIPAPRIVISAAHPASSPATRNVATNTAKQSKRVQSASATTTVNQCRDDVIVKAAVVEPSTVLDVVAGPSITPAAVAALETASVASTSESHRGKDHNSVTIKQDTSVKDAAGAVFKVLNRLGTAFVTALRLETTNESLNKAVKSIAVARKYVLDNNHGQDYELTFLPFNRCNSSNRTDANLFAFLVFKTVVTEALKSTDQTDLNVSKSSDINKMANAIISIILDRGQAVMKAGGSDAVFIAMSAVINARHRLLAKHNFDLMLAPAFITENTMGTLGRESKFLKFNIVKCEANGPKSDVHPSMSSYEGSDGNLRLAGV